MSFRIRNPDSDDFTAYEKAYRQHLSRFKDMTQTHLWKFFWWDFFHDGEVGPIQVESDLKTMVIEWASQHQSELLENWERARNEQVPSKIAPLS